MLSRHQEASLSWERMCHGPAFQVRDFALKTIGAALSKQGRKVQESQQQYEEAKVRHLFAECFGAACMRTYRIQIEVRI